MYGAQPNPATGQQQTVLPLLAAEDFGLTGYTVIFTYIAAFGITKATSNYAAGILVDRLGRKPVLLTGWLFAVPVPAMLILAPDWGWVVAANVLLGINQGLTWSTTVVMKIDLIGPEKRGLAMGLNEAAGYGAVAITSCSPDTSPPPTASAGTVPTRSSLRSPGPDALDAAGKGNPRPRRPRTTSPQTSLLTTAHAPRTHQLADLCPQYLA